MINRVAGRTGKQEGQVSRKDRLAGRTGQQGQCSKKDIPSRAGHKEQGSKERVARTRKSRHDFSPDGKAGA